MPQQCGWLQDRHGLYWQIVPAVMFQMMADPDRAKAKRTTDAMVKMVKLNIAALGTGFAGRALSLRCCGDASLDPQVSSEADGD